MVRHASMDIAPHVYTGHASAGDTSHVASLGLQEPCFGGLFSCSLKSKSNRSHPPASLSPPPLNSPLRGLYTKIKMHAYLYLMYCVYCFCQGDITIDLYIFELVDRHQESCWRY